MFQSKKRVVILIFVVAFALRMLAVLALRDIHAGPTMTFGADGIEFNELGQQIALGHGYELEPGNPTAFRAPGFPFFLAGVYFWAGQNYPLVYALFCALGGATCVLTYLIASELGGSNLAVLASILSTVYINGIYFATVFASENVLLVCLGLSVWLFLRYLKNNSCWDLSLAALSIGWGILTRPFALLLLPVFGFILLWHMWTNRRFRFGHAILFGLVPLAVVAPWTIRNYSVFHQFVLVANNGGSTFYGGNNDRVLSEPYYYGSWISTTELPFRNLIDATPDEVSRDHEEWHLGIQWVMRHKKSMPLLWLYKFIRLWAPDIASINRKYVMSQLIFATPFIVLILIGLFRSVVQRAYRTPEWVLVHGVIAATIVTALIFWGSPRFRDATLPVLMIYAALGMQLFLPRSGAPPKIGPEESGHPSMNPGS